MRFWAIVCWLLVGCSGAIDSGGGNGGGSAGGGSAGGGSAGGGGAGGGSAGGGSAGGGSAGGGSAGGATAGGATAGGGGASGGSSGGAGTGGGSAGGTPSGVLAFPGAEGFGARVTGGRGGRVIKVTTLNPTGPGSLDAALRATGPRIIVFAVSGLINGDFDITEPNVTIAGQTAPGAGITIVGRLWAPFAESDGSSRVQNLIIRHLRVRHICRPGTPDSQCDTMRLSSQSRFILDHLSLSWGIDETLDMWGGSHDWTIQNTTFEHPCLDSTGSPNHAYGVLNRRGGRGSILRTGMLTVRDRNPAFADGPFDVINMFVYNHQTGLTHHNPATGAFNVIGNYYRRGSSGGIAKPFWLGGSQTSATEPQYWFNDNYLDDSATAPFGAFNDPWTANHSLLGSTGMGGVPTTNRASSRHDFSTFSGWVPPTIVSPVAARDLVLDTAGAFPRDVVTRDAVSEARNRTGQFGCAIRQQLDAQGNVASGAHPLMAGLSPATAPVDADDDGMADTWETARGLDPSNGSDHATVLSSGYTAIETYINELADQLVP